MKSNFARLALIFAQLAMCISLRAETVATGEFTVDHSPVELLGDGAKKIESVIAQDERITWEMFVPETYDVKKPAGLLVNVSPMSSGEIPRQWKSVLEEHNLIWISANESGNRVLVTRRVLYAIIAPNIVTKSYAIDRERMYLSGLSGGGKVASMVAIDYANTFRGAIYNCGVEVWDGDEPRMIDAVRKNRYVFVTGEYDQALGRTKSVYRRYRKAGIENSKLMVINKMTHRNPDRHEFEKAVLYLDSR
jgi:hypothetical protein